MEEPLRLEFTCTLEEQSRAKGLVTRQVLAGGSKLRFWTLSIVLFGAGGWALFLQLEPGERLLWFGIFAVVWVVTYFLLRGRAPGLTRIWLLPGIVRVITPKVDRQFEPSELAPLLESEELFVLRNRAKTIMVPVPKRVFADAEAQGRFRALLGVEAARA